MLADYDAKNPEALVRLKSNGVEMRKFSDDILAAAEREAFALMETEASADPAYASLFDDWKKFRASSYEWSKLAETAFASFAFGR